MNSYRRTEVFSWQVLLFQNLLSNRLSSTLLHRNTHLFRYSIFEVSSFNLFFFNLSISTFILSISDSNVPSFSSLFFSVSKHSILIFSDFLEVFRLMLWNLKVILLSRLIFKFCTRFSPNQLEVLTRTYRAFLHFLFPKIPFS